MSTGKALAPTTDALRKLGDFMHWIMFHHGSGLAEQWERGDSWVVLPDNLRESPFVKGNWREIAPFMVAMGAQIPGFRIIPQEAADETLAMALGGARLLPTKDKITFIPERYLNIADKLNGLADRMQEKFNDTWGEAQVAGLVAELLAEVRTLSTECADKVLVKPTTWGGANLVQHYASICRPPASVFPSGTTLAHGDTTAEAVANLQVLLDGKHGPIDQQQPHCR